MLKPKICFCIFNFSTFFFSKNVHKTGFYFKTHHDDLLFPLNSKPDYLFSV